MAKDLDEATLVHRLKLVQRLGTTKAAKKEGIQPSAMRTSITQAKARGLTATTKVDEAGKLRTRVKVLEAELAEIQRENLSAAEIRRTLYGLAEMTPNPPQWMNPKRRKPKSSGVPVVVLSDWHYGERVNKEEVGGVNEFNRSIAKRRVRRCVEATIDLAKGHMVRPEYPGVVVCLGGDMISGNIHEEITETNDGPVQQSLLEVQELLEWAITQFADAFGKVFVPCVVGNHGRMTRKPRAKGRVFTSYEWNLYCQLERYFRNDKRVQFMIPGEADAHFSILGHRFLLTHGDSLGVKGGDGIIGSIGPITRGAMKIGRSQAQIGRDFDTLIIGHWHQYMPRGVSGILVNNSLKGFDEFVHLMLRAPYSAPSQSLFFVHEKYGVTAQWEVLLEPRISKRRPAKTDWVQWRAAA